MNSVTGLASEIISGLYGPSDINTTTVQYWVRNNLGQLNVALYADFALDGSGDAQTITGEYPSWSDQIGDIYKKMYEIHYYRKQIMTILPAGSTNQIMEVNSDGARIKMVNKSEIAKTYKSLKNEAEEQLDFMVASYNMGRAGTRQVAGDDIFNSYGSISSSENYYKY